jgi:regulatory protein
MSEEEAPSSTPEYIKAEKSALRLIARAEQCCRGLANKLEKRGHDTASVSAVILKLSEQNLINDSRFAQLWLESRLRLTRSPRRLFSSLCTRGIEHDDAKAALKAVLNEETEFELLKRFIKKNRQKTSGKGNSNSEEIDLSLKYLLKNEGFSPQVIQRFSEGE